MAAKQPHVVYCIASMSGGGAERQVTYLAAGLRARGWRVSVLLLRGGPNLAALEASGAEIVYLRHASNSDPRIGLQILGYLRRTRPDVVQTWLPLMDIFGSLAAWVAGVPLVGSERSSSEAAYPPTPRNRLRRYLIGRRARALVANSEAGLRYWDAHLRSNALRRVIKNALALDRLAAAPVADGNALGIRADQFVVLSAGRFVAAKNLDVLFPVLERLVQAHPNVVAVVAGDGSLRQPWADWVAARGLADRIRVTGYLDDLWSWMKRANCFLSTSIFEGQPNVVLEAMACGCPLVVSDIAQHREFLDERSAALAAVTSAEAFIGAVESIMNDSAAAQSRARAAAELVAQGSVAGVAAQYDALYRDVMG